MECDPSLCSVNLISHLFLSSEELPEIDNWPCVTALDKSLRNLRKVNLQQIVESALSLKHGAATDVSMVLDQAEDWALRLRNLAEEVSVAHQGRC